MSAFEDKNPDGWNSIPLGELIDPQSSITYGVVKPGPEDRNGVKFVRGGDIRDGQIDIAELRTITKAVSDGYKRTVLVGGEVLMALVGYPGAVAIVPSELRGANIARQAALIRLGNRVTNRYVVHFFRSDVGRSRLFQKAGGSAQQVINLADLKFVDLPVPSDPAEQLRIAEILDTADAAIQKTEALVAKLKQMKAGLLHDLLTRGIDENGELRDPAGFVDGIPAQWKKVLLRDLVPDTEYGISTALQDLGDLPVLRMNNLQDGEAFLQDIRYASTTVPPQLLLKPGDVLFNRTNSYAHVGRTGIWRGQIEKATFASYLVRLNPDKGQLTSEYLNHWLNLPSTQVAIRKFATPAVQQVNINPTMLRKTLISLPRSVAEQQEVTRRVDALSNRIIAERNEIEKLQKLKAGLMHDLLTGKKRVNQPALAAT